MNSLRLILCDDAASHNALLQALLKKLLEKNKLEAKIELITDSPEQVLAFAHTHRRDCLFFLDLDFGSAMDGFELARLIRQTDAWSYIVFITAHQEYMQRCFSVKASDFLLKPFLEAQLEQCLIGIFREHRLIQGEMAFAVQVRSCHYRFPYDCIDYFEKRRVYISIHTEKDQVQYRGTFISLLEELPSDIFIRVHHGYIANITKAVLYDQHDQMLELTGGQHVPVSRKYARNVRSALQGSVYHA
jgi:two-component system response regulator AgrA